MKIKYIKREIYLADFLGVKLRADVKWILDYFKDLTYRYEKDKKGMESWYNKSGQRIILIWEEKWDYIIFSYKTWDFLAHKYTLNHNQVKNLIHYLLELTLKREVYTPKEGLLGRSRYWD